MMTKRGCSECTEPGKEQYEYFTTQLGRRKVRRCMYDYRHTDGELFGVVCHTLAECRAKRDEWLMKKGA